MRYQAYLRQRYRTLLGYIGGIWFVVGLTMLSPLMVLPFFPDEVQYASAFLLTGVPLAIGGLVVRWHTRLDDAPSPTLQEGMVAIVIAWVSAIAIGAVPLMLIVDLTFTQAIFEATSGWTTTGLSVVDVESAPHVLLFYRSAMQLIGGAGFAIIVLSSITGPVGSGLSVAEGRDDLLAPHVRHSANIVIRIYVVYIVLGIVGLFLAGMSWFDAVNHAMAALSTGGFSTRAASIGYWDSAAIEAVIIVLMILGTLNYMTAYVLLQGKFKAIIKNGEVRVMTVLLPIGFVLLFFGVTLAIFDGGWWRALRVAIFEFTSALSTTGFSTMSYSAWSQFGWMVLIIAMFIGGGSGSTAGGIKQFRIYVLIKALLWEIRRAFMPDHAVNEAVIWKGSESRVLSDKQIRRIALFVWMYMVIFFVMVLLIVAHGYSIGQAMFEAASTVSTVGLSVGVTAADAPVTLLWAQSFGMLLGRLEFFALVIGVIKLVRDGYAMLRPNPSQTQS